MKFNEFISGAYSPRSIKAESQELTNFYLERVESDAGKASYTIYRSPGLASFCATGIDGPARGALSLNGHTYWVIGDRLIEVFSSGSFTDYSLAAGVFIAGGSAPVSLAASPTQLMVTGGGHGYVLELAAVHEIASADFPTGTAGPCAFLDGYFIVLIQDSQQFQISTINDADGWDASQISSVESRPDFCVAVWPRGEDLWMYGDQSIQIFYNNGNADFPFVPNQSAVSQMGLVAPNSVAHFGDQLMWLWGEDSGRGIVYMTEGGYVPQRISDHAIENTIQNYSGDMADAIGMSFQLNGHLFYRLYFPGANGGLGATWQCDIAMAKQNRALSWSKVTRWNNGIEEAHIGRVMVSGFGKTLVGSRLDGTIYDMSMAYLDDAGAVIRRVRQAPHMYNEGKQIVYNEIGFGGNTGIGIQPADPDNPTLTAGYDPVSSLIWSDDGGKTWGNERSIRWGKLGEYSILPRTFDCGVGRDRVWKMVFTDPVDFCLVDCYWEGQLLKN